MTKLTTHHSPLTTILLHHQTTTPLYYYTGLPVHLSRLTTHLSLRVIFDRKLYREVILSYQFSRCLYIIYCLLSFLHRPKKKQIPKALGTRLIFMSLKTTKAVPPRKANRFTSAMLHYPFFTAFLFSKFHKKQAVFFVS